ncbi:MAG: prepilin-type N-terminal cleavage/methylation domain-containing protein [Planctomycetes bacterium]|nr:prepilin-type N-terminal cleavage/methylation domain-containing protein [Planctomycetota bacterium]
MSELQKNYDGGFTIVELMVGSVISLIVLGIAFSMFNVQRKVFSVQEQRSEMQQNVRAAMDMMVREIRMAGYDPQNTGFVEIAAGTSTATSLQVSADLDGSGGIVGSETITYSYDALNDQIDRDIGGGFQPFVENIASMNFSYFDASDFVTATAADIRKIQIQITGRTANIDPRTGDYEFGTQTSFVSPKNLGY